ncbi:acyl-CoA carboxylase epsilon subunit [Diaminobutyricibacter sp. McL0608]|uniref:acyl-CoA carboxylase epsilon subunit n=1 Tax=Leifsonia sp. McL0608 TaxID=3143537 RepID=UPI0031F2FE8F
MADGSNGGSMSENDLGSDLTFLTRVVTPAEVAAVTAVLTAALAEHAADRAVRSRRGPSAWERSQRPLRAPLAPGYGAWRGFTG